MYMQWLLDSLELEAFSRTIIYASSIKHVSDLYNYSCPSNINRVDMFYSETTYEKKSDIIKKLHDGDSDLKLLIATFALGMGIDIANCHAVILFGIPSTTTDLVQEVGRIGRDGKESIALLLYMQMLVLNIYTPLSHVDVPQS